MIFSILKLVAVQWELHFTFPSGYSNDLIFLVLKESDLMEFTLNQSIYPPFATYCRIHA